MYLVLCITGVRDGDIPRAQRFDQRIQYLQQNNILSFQTFESKKLELMTGIIEAKYDKVLEFQETLGKVIKSTST